jgi:hypothetical protein
MDDSERTLLLDKIERLENTLMQRQDKGKTAEDYIREQRMYGDPPKDQYGHSHKLLFHPHQQPQSQMDLLPEDAILGGTESIKQLFLLQKDNEILNRFYDIGVRSKGVMAVFDSLFYSWWQQMRMTGTINFTERLLQSFIEPPFITYQGMGMLDKAKQSKGKGLNMREMIARARGMGGRGESGGGPYD